MRFSEALARILSGGLSAELNRVEVWLPWALRGVKVLIILIGAWLITRIARRLLRNLRAYIVRAMDRDGRPSQELEKRAATIVAVLSKVVGITVWLVALVMGLNELTYNVQPLLAGLGVAGLAVGLGAQTLIKDWLGGLFLLLEDQLRIGDAVTIIGTSGAPISGAVEEINLRTTVLRAENGAVYVIPNGSIAQLSNSTREYAYYIFETTLAHGADAKRALEILASVGAELAATKEFQLMILAPIEVMGVDRLTEHGTVIRARIKTVAAKQANVGRELNLRVKTAFDAAGIPFPPV
ncbi:MAG TPA: mechanosensitive ion channel family protein [Bryobacteraceae bacterium]|nr:mechanosensitive ion channel family protein [Bryobacteraceae bacterium]